MSTSRFVRSALLALTTAILLPSGAEAAELAKQVVVFKTKRNSRVRVSLVPGDRVATLAVTRPPKGLVKKLQDQLGLAMVSVERIDLVDDVLRIALGLGNESYRLKIRALRRKSRAYSIVFYPNPYSPTVAPHTLIGRVPDTPPRRKLPFVLPATPKRHPCQRFPETERIIGMFGDRAPPAVTTVVAFAKKLPDLECRDFFLAQVAAAHLQRHRDLANLKGWAFNFSGQDRWNAYPFAYSYTALVASAVLMRAGFLPEVEALLATDRIQTSKRLIPFRGLLMSELLLLRRDTATAQQLLRALFREQMMPQIRDAAALRLTELATKDGPQQAAWVLRTIVPRLPRSSPLHAMVSVRAGELALAMDDPKRARRFFTRATQSTDRRLKNHALLRLGDLEVRKGTKAARRRAHKLYERVDRRERCLAAMARLRTTLLDGRDRERLEQNVMDAVDEPQCTGHEMDARYAMAELSIVRDQFAYAIRLLEAAEEHHDDRWSSRKVFHDEITRIAALAVARLRRNRDWTGLVDLYRKHLASRQASLSSSSLHSIATALNRVGLNSEAAKVVRTTLKQNPSGDDFERLTVVLARSYLDADQLYLAEIVLDYFRQVRSRSEKLWEVQLTHAELLLRQGNAAAALEILRAAEKSTPKGDPRARLLVLRSEAEYALSNAEAAAAALLEALQGPWLPSLETRGRGVNVLSLCLRQCKKKTLERLLKSIETNGQDTLLSERIRYLGKKRGIGPKPKLEESSVWKRLEEVAPELKVSRGAARKGGNQ